ncbi:hypothetical protein SSX86_020826 [Deinandra increscens subsp. villosa]|uniref:Integrase catalytic domain-containing protein n=1 Tax=Deinandra increscens subsp. villosa TaxID=3103831 RepID=A0AAP0CTR6_9ASTR
MRVAVVGGGLSGLVSAYILAKEGVEVVLYEKEDRLGGHAKTTVVNGIDLDLGFMAFNRVTYPNMMELFETLGVDMEASDMSFSVSLDDGNGCEWGSRNGFSSLFAQKKNLLNPHFWNMLWELNKFKDDVLRYIEHNQDDSHRETLQGFIMSQGYSELFQKTYLIPLCSSIWSCHAEQVLGFSAFSVLSFLYNHHNLQVFGHPKWLTVRNRSLTYVKKLKEDLERRGCQIRVGCLVQSISKLDNGCLVICEDGSQERYNGCIIATHASDALRMIGEQASYEEKRILGAFNYFYRQFIFTYGIIRLIGPSPLCFVCSPSSLPSSCASSPPSMATGSEDLRSLNTALHMAANIKLSSTNFLVWRQQMVTILSFQKLLGHVDGSSPMPPTVIASGDKDVANPAYDAWVQEEDKAVLLLQNSLSEETMAVILGITSAHQIWNTLAAAFSNASTERVHNLKEQLWQMTRGSQPVSEYVKRFKSVCDMLAAVGKPVDDSEKTYWFLRGLGPSFLSFSSVVQASQPLPSFTDLTARAQSHEILLQNYQGASSTPQVAFSAQTSRNQGAVSNPKGQKRSNNYNRGNKGKNKGREPRCYLCRLVGHYADACPTHEIKPKNTSMDANLVHAFNAQCNLSNSEANADWYVDTGATAHMSLNSENVANQTPYTGKISVTVANGTQVPITHTGLSRVHPNITLKDVLVVPSLKKNLLSISKLTDDNDIDVVFSKNYFAIQDRCTRKVLARGSRKDGLYVLHADQQAFLTETSSSNKVSFETWHNRLGHVTFETISFLNKLGCVKVTSVLPKPVLCSSCQVSKAHRLPFILNEKRALNILDLVHCDLWGPSPVTAIGGFRYYVVFIDDHSRFTWFYPLKAKSEFSVILSVFLNFVQTQFDRKLKVFQSDGGLEFVNNTVRKIFETNGTFHQLSCPYTPQQNGRAERKHRHLVETGLAMMFNSHVPAKYWVDAFSTATYTINRLPTKVLGNKSPFEVIYNRRPVYDNFRTFGCQVFPYLRDYAAHKLAPRSLACIFMGYCSQYKGYKCLEPLSSRVYITRHARFNESMFPFSGENTTSKIALELTTFILDHEGSEPRPPVPSPVSTPSPTNTPLNPCILCPSDAPVNPSPNLGPTSTIGPTPNPSQVTTPSPSLATNSTPVTSPVGPNPSPVPDGSPLPNSPATPLVVPQQPPTNPHPAPLPGHPMQTRAKSGIFKTKHHANLTFLEQHKLCAALFAAKEPRGFKSAAKDPHWMQAMNEEMYALIKNNTWTLVPRPKTSNVVGSKWLFRTKYHSDGSIERHKARLVARGFTQIPGMDFSHTFSPVVKASTIRIVLTLAVINSWKLHQLDVKNAFLHGHLTETIYMEQPPGFSDPTRPNHVCKLNKALYGLKQAPRAWFHRLSSFLIHNGFLCSKADPSLFIFKRDACILYLLVYVDDLILTGNNEAILSSFIKKLHSEFAIKDLGLVNYFLGLEVKHNKDGLFLSQSKYAYEITERAKLLDAKPVHTPMASHENLTSQGIVLEDPTEYRSLVGALQYLTITRPDISYSVNQVSQFLKAPTMENFQNVKRIIRYIKGTLDFGLTFSRPSSTTLVGYSDADWARCLETRRSTYGYSIFLGGNLVSWSAKKQPTISRSSCESEYRAMANTAAEIVWITHLLRELHALPCSRPTLLCDNQSALFLTQNPVSHKRSKHIDLDYHFIRELVSSGKLLTMFVPTKLQIVTKADLGLGEAYVNGDFSLVDKNKGLLDMLTLRVEKSHEVLDIGCGWGGFAIEIVKQTGCKYTGITLSKEQIQYAESKVKKAGLQFISVQDQKYDEFRRSPGFVREYIFPGGNLPSLSILTSVMAASSRFWKIFALGYNQEFIRTWEYYFDSTAAGFKMETLNDYQEHRLEKKNIKMRFAVVGGGLSGLVSAYVLAKAGVKVVLYEKEDSLGGQVKTTVVDGIDLDLGFMVFNRVTYPNMMELFETLEVDMETSDMSFSVSLDDGNGCEWGSRSGFSSLFAQKKNLLNPHFWHMLWELTKFKDDVLRFLEHNQDISHGETLQGFIISHGYSELFQKAYLVSKLQNSIVKRS